MNLCLTCRWFTLELSTGRAQSAPSKPDSKIEASGHGQFENSYPPPIGFGGQA